MGILRFLLAVAVIIGHTTPIFGLTLTGPEPAVETFFMISGFYMALILNEKYTRPGAFRLFLSNRFLKIFPMYWLVLMMVAASGALMWKLTGNPGVFWAYAEHKELMNGATLLELLITHLAIFGQDVALFFQLGPQGCTFAPSLAHATLPLYKFMLIPQAWSLGLELTFYLLAVKVVRRSWLAIAGLMLASLALRAVLWNAGYQGEPWTYRFFPSELFFFLAGALAYKGYGLIKHLQISSHVLYGIQGGILAFTLALSFLPISTWVYYACFAVAMPFIFMLTKKSTVDGYIGELSYPMYISHLFVAYIASFIQKHLKILPSGQQGLIVLIVTILISMLLLKMVEPIERYRQARIVGNSRRDASLAINAPEAAQTT